MKILLSILLVVFTVAVLLAACITHEEPVVPLSQLTSDPEKYMGKTVSVDGEVVRSLGERSYFLAFPYFVYYPCGKSSRCPSLRLSLSQVKVGTFEFSDGMQSIIVTERKGGYFVPIPIVPAGSMDLPKGNIRITGLWTKDQEGNYQLHVSGTEAVPSAG